MNEKEYWDKRARTYLDKTYFLTSPSRFFTKVFYEPTLKTMILSRLKKISPQSLLEVGCGPGRLFDSYKNIAHVVGVDFSPQMLERAKKLIKKKKYDNIELRLMDARNLKFSSNSFDVILTSNVLLHIRPEKIQKAINEITRVSKKWIICAELSDKKKEGWNCFAHDYVKLFSGAQIVSNTGIPFSNQKMLLFRKVKK